MKTIPLIEREDIQKIIKSGKSNEEKASIIYDKINEYMRMSNDGFFDMPCNENDIIEFLENENKS